MNQKRLRYALIGGVVLIWGLIIYRVINGLSSDEPVVATKKQISKINYDVASDSFILFANYPDPFIKDETDLTFVKDNIPTTSNQLTIPGTQIDKPLFDFGIVEFRGMIVNPETKRKIAFISVKGREYTVKEGDEIEGLSVKKITATEILVSADGKSAPIHLKKG